MNLPPNMIYPTGFQDVLVVDFVVVAAFIFIDVVAAISHVPSKKTHIKTMAGFVDPIVDVICVLIPKVVATGLFLIPFTAYKVIGIFPRCCCCAAACS